MAGTELHIADGIADCGVTAIRRLGGQVIGTPWRYPGVAYALEIDPQEVKIKATFRLLLTLKDNYLKTFQDIAQ